MSLKYNYTRPWMYAKQENAIFNDARYAVVEASTKSGKTVGCIIWLVELALTEGGHGRNYWWVAPVSDQAHIAWERCKDFVPRNIYTTNETHKRMDLNNGSHIWFKTGDAPDSLYGEDVYGCVIDEATRVKEESWYAIRSTITATRAPVRIIGNVKGRRNWAYKLARQAELGERDNMSYNKITAYDAAEAGVLEWDEIQDAFYTYPDWMFRELYLAEPPDDGGNPFGIDHIGKCTVEGLSDKDPICWGWDVAKSINWTVGIGLDTDGKVCRFERFRDSWENTIPQILGHSKGKPTLVDSTGSGDQLLERLRKLGGQLFVGYKFTGPSKQDLMLGLAVAIQNGDIAFPDGPIRKELEMFEYEEKQHVTIYQAPKGYHDDCVDALALAVKKWRAVTAYPTNAFPVSIEQRSQFIDIM